jgi:hypothetical protein
MALARVEIPVHRRHQPFPILSQRGFMLSEHVLPFGERAVGSADLLGDCAPLDQHPNRFRQVSLCSPSGFPFRNQDGRPAGRVSSSRARP